MSPRPDPMKGSEARERRWFVEREHPPHHRLQAIAFPVSTPDAITLAAPLLFNSVEPIAGRPELLRVEREDCAAVVLNPDTGAWRCTATGQEGTGTLELIAWARGCTFTAAACWFHAVRRAARIEARYMARRAA